MSVQIGDRFKKLVVIGFDRLPLRARDKVDFLCDCGVRKRISLYHVTAGATKSCGCTRRKHVIGVGQVFGRLTVTSNEFVMIGKHNHVLCKCNCGTEKMIGVANLSLGITKSCGCIVVEAVRKLSLKHGKEQHLAYKVWVGMRERCLNSDSMSYKNYGGRGISICDEWVNGCKTFCDWADANGHAAGLEIDRKDNNGDYTPENCHFITSQANSRNRRSNVIATAFGKTATVKELSEDARCVVSYEALRGRIHRGINPETAMVTPAQAGKPIRAK